MAHDVEVNLKPGDSRRLDGLAWPAFAVCLGVGIGALVLAVIVALIYQFTTGDGLRRFGFAYLTGYTFLLTLSLGMLFFVMATHLFRGGWGILVRRVAETFSGAMPMMAILFVPILIYILLWNGQLYPWAQSFPTVAHENLAKEDPSGAMTQSKPYGRGNIRIAAYPGSDARAKSDTDGDADRTGGDPPGRTKGQAAAGADADGGGRGEASGGKASTEAEGAAEAEAEAVPTLTGMLPNNDMTELAHSVRKKRAYLGGLSFSLRWYLYVVCWSFMGVWFWRMSTRQDLTGDITLTQRMEYWSAPLMILFGLMLTFGAFDLVMSLDPRWPSTMFGIFYFAGAFQSSMCLLILLLLFLQWLGFVPSVNKEHYHDLGKLAYAFVIFWMYVTFAQYMLIWYGVVPIEQPWMIVRGMSTNSDLISPWGALALVLLFGRFFFPFFGMMSRHVKRNKKTLAFFAVWLLLMEWIESYWLVMPEFDPTRIPVPIIAVLCTIGLLGLYGAAVIRLAARNSLVPVGDPRLNESLRFTNT